MPHYFLPSHITTPFSVTLFLPTNNHLLFSMIHKSCIFPSIVFQFITFCNRWFSYLKQKPTSLCDECAGSCLRHFELGEPHFVSQFKLFHPYLRWFVNNAIRTNGIVPCYSCIRESTAFTKGKRRIGHQCLAEIEKCSVQ